MSSTNQDRKDLPADEPLGVLEPLAHFDAAMPTGVTVSHQGRIFVNFPKWGDEVPFTVSEIHDGGEVVVAYPDEATNQTNPNDPAAALVSVQSVVVDPADRLWILDTGSPYVSAKQVWRTQACLCRFGYEQGYQEDSVSAGCSSANYLS